MEDFLAQFIKALPEVATTPKRDLAKKEPVWTCAVCGAPHRADRDECRRCYKPRPAAVAPQAVNGAAPSPPGAPVAAAPPGDPPRDAQVEAALQFLPPGTLERAGILPGQAWAPTDPLDIMRAVGLRPASVRTAPASVAAVAPVRVTTEPAVPHTSGTATAPRAEPAKALQELLVLQQRIAKNQAAVARLEQAIADSQAELAVSRKAIQVLEKDYAKLHAEVGVSQEPAASSALGDDRDLADVVQAVRQVVATLQDHGQLQYKYELYADAIGGDAAPLEPAAWITNEIALHLSSLTAFCDRVDAGYRLVKKRKADGA
jgi:hypothetical protein